MDDRKIFECVAKIPGIRAVQIQDMLDMELADVSEALRELVDAGDLVRKSGFAPNGVAAQCYDFSEQFKRGNDYKAVMAGVGIDVDVSPAAPEPRAAAPTPSPMPTQPAKVGDVPSRAERAMAFILKNGSATDDDLRFELAMRQGEYPSSILGHAVKAGRVTRLNNRWVPGDGRPVMDPPKKQFGGATLAPTPVPSFLADTKPATPTVKPNGGAGKPKAAAAPAPAVVDVLVEVEAPPLAPFRCGLWSDGVVELQRNGVTVTELSADEAERLFKFIDGVLPVKVPA